MTDDGPQTDEQSKQPRLRALTRPGVIGSIVLHATVLGLLLYEVGVPPALVPIVPIELVQLFEQTTSAAPQPDAKAALPTAGASDRLASVQPPRTTPRPVPRSEPAPAIPAAPPSAEQPAPDTSPSAPPDPLQSQLDALSKLRMPDGSGSRAPGSNAPQGAQSGYRVEDLIRAQVQRRWTLRLDELGERDLVVTIHIVLEPDGTVAKAEIVNPVRGRNDETYRSIAISARNAVLLSSPLTLPAGMTDDMRDMMVSFNTRDSLR